MQRQRAHDIFDDVMNLRRLVAKILQGRTQRLVGDFEVSAASKFLELDERKVRLDAGGVAVHQQADGAGRGDDRGLRVAIPVALAEA